MRFKVGDIVRFGKNSGIHNRKNWPLNTDGEIVEISHRIVINWENGGRLVGHDPKGMGNCLKLRRRPNE